jgi:ferric-dicitrate binding protein FerR (iron transport regulator)
VRTTGLRIDVLGTRFNVNHRRNKTEVVLQEGRVQVSGDETTNDPAINGSTVMRPGDMLTYSEMSHRLTKTIINPETIISWKDKLLIFKDKPIVEIVQILSDTYGIQVDFRNQSIAAKRFSGSVPTDSVGIFFEKLEKLYGVSIRQTGQRYVID